MEGMRVIQTTPPETMATETTPPDAMPSDTDRLRDFYQALHQTDRLLLLLTLSDGLTPREVAAVLECQEQQVAHSLNRLMAEARACVRGGSFRRAEVSIETAPAAALPVPA
jgi:DNA-directed RNA polymerase specialized sigma24 family protein